MPPKTSPTHDVTELLGRRSLATIPKDQKTLLEAEGSWAVDMKDGPHGLSTVPSHVLQTLKEAFVRLKDKTDQGVQDGQGNQEDEEGQDDQEDHQDDPDDQEDQEDQENQRDEEGQKDNGDKEGREDPKQMETTKRPLTVNNGDKENGSSPGSIAARSSKVPAFSERPIASSPEREISWPASPSRAGGHPDASDPGSPIDEEYKSPLLAPFTQPPPPEADDAAAPGPSSGISEPDDLEMEVPRAQTNHHEAPINRVATLVHTATPQEPTGNLTNTASTTDTPPCAQPRVSSGPRIPIPTPQLSMLSTDPIHHRTRRMKAILFDEDGPTASGTPPIRFAPSTRMPFARAHPEPGFQSSAPLSSAASTPYDDDMMESSPPIPPPHRFVRDAAPQNRGPGRQDEINRLPHSDPEASHARQTPIGHLYKIQAAIDVLISKSGDPYSAFTATYPDYATVHSGNLLSFVEACCHLYELQEKRLIREYLYDDFIRAWSGYLKYALSGPSHLPAIEWFNDLRGPILFNRMCVNKDNLDTVLGAYPEEVARIKAAMSQSKQRRSAPELATEMEQDVEIVDLVDDDSIMDDSALEARRGGWSSVSRAQKRPRAASAGDMLPPTRQPPTVPAPSRTAPAPPPPRPPIPRAASPDLGSDDFDYLPYPAKPSSLAKPHPQPQAESLSRSRSRSKTQQAQPESIPQPQIQPQLQPKMHRNLPERSSPRRHPTTSAVISSPASTTRRQPQKSSNPRAASQPAADYLGNLVSKGRTTPSSSARSGSSKPRKRTAEERARLREHFRKKASTSSTSFIGSSIDN